MQTAHPAAAPFAFRILMLFRSFLVVIGALLFPLSLAGQVGPPIEIGSRIWIRLDRPQWPLTAVPPSVLRGTLTEAPGDSLILALENDTGEARVPITAVHSLYLSLGPRTRFEGALRAIPSGLAHGLLIGVLASQVAETDPRLNVYLTAAGAGALAWAVRGWITPGERLRRVPLTAPGGQP